MTRDYPHDLDVTVWVGKRGVDAVVDELARQLRGSEFVKVRFLRSSRTAATEEMARELAEEADVHLVETRGNTAVYSSDSD